MKRVVPKIVDDVVSADCCCCFFFFSSSSFSVPLQSAAAEQVVVVVVVGTGCLLWLVSAANCVVGPTFLIFQISTLLHTHTHKHTHTCTHTHTHTHIYIFVHTYSAWHPKSYIEKQQRSAAHHRDGSKRVGSQQQNCIVGLKLPTITTHLLVLLRFTAWLAATTAERQALLPWLGRWSHTHTHTHTYFCYSLS